MYGSGQSGSQLREELRAALLRLETALADQEAKERELPAGADDPALQVLRRSVAVMRAEAERLRRLLGPA